MRLSPVARDAVMRAEQACVSAVSGYEIAFKLARGRMPGAEALAPGLEPFISQEGFAELRISLAHAEAAGRLPWHHRDPFDRLLVAQALVEGLRLVSADAPLDAYGIDRLW